MLNLRWFPVRLHQLACLRMLEEGIVSRTQLVRNSNGFCLGVRLFFLNKVEACPSEHYEGVWYQKLHTWWHPVPDLLCWDRSSQTYHRALVKFLAAAEVDWLL